MTPSRLTGFHEFNVLWTDCGCGGTAEFEETPAPNLRRGAASTALQSVEVTNRQSFSIFRHKAVTRSGRGWFGVAAGTSNSVAANGASVGAGGSFPPQPSTWMPRAWPSSAPGKNWRRLG